MANLETLSILTGQKSISDMTDDELRDHIRQIRHARLVPTIKKRGPSEPKSKKSPTATKARTTKNPMDALLRSLKPEELEVMLEMLKEIEE